MAVVALSLIVCLPSPAIAVSNPCLDCGVNGQDKGAEYRGALLLPPGSDAGLAGTAAHCDGCSWRVVPKCRDTAGTGDANCNGAARLCAPGDTRMQLFLERPTWAAFRMVGEFCQGLGDALTPVALIPGVRDQFVRFLPALAPSFEPRGRGIVNLPVLFATGQPQSIGRKAFPLGAYQIELEAQTTWHWDFGDWAAADFTRPGGSYPDTDVAHTYGRQQTCTVTVTATWAGRFWVDGAGPFEVTGAPITQRATMVVPIKEARAVLVG
jgi:PKD domain